MHYYGIIQLRGVIHMVTGQETSVVSYQHKGSINYFQLNEQNMVTKIPRSSGRIYQDDFTQGGRMSQGTTVILSGLY